VYSGQAFYIRAAALQLVRGKEGRKKKKKIVRSGRGRGLENVLNETITQRFDVLGMLLYRQRQH